jgi:hypothetical protein
MTSPYLAYYSNQAGSGIGPYYVGGTPYHRGRGIGSWLSGLFRTVFPLVKSGAKAIGKEALNSGFGLLKDAITQKPIKASIRQRVREAGENLMSKVDKKIESMQGSGRGRKRKRGHSSGRSGSLSRARSSRRAASGKGGRSGARSGSRRRLKAGYKRRRTARPASQRLRHQRDIFA